MVMYTQPRFRFRYGACVNEVNESKYILLVRHPAGGRAEFLIEERDRYHRFSVRLSRFLREKGYLVRLSEPHPGAGNSFEFDATNAFCVIVLLWNEGHPYYPEVSDWLEELAPTDYPAKSAQKFILVLLGEGVPLPRYRRILELASLREWVLVDLRGWEGELHHPGLKCAH